MEYRLQIHCLHLINIPRGIHPHREHIQYILPDQHEVLSPSSSPHCRDTKFIDICDFTMKVEIIGLITTRTFELKLRFGRVSIAIFSQYHMKYVFVSTGRTGFRTPFEAYHFFFFKICCSQVIFIFHKLSTFCIAFPFLDFS